MSSDTVLIFHSFLYGFHLKIEVNDKRMFSGWLQEIEREDFIDFLIGFENFTARGLSWSISNEMSVQKQPFCYFLS